MQLICLLDLYLVWFQDYLLLINEVCSTINSTNEIIYEDEFQRALQEDGSASSTFITPKAYYPGTLMSKYATGKHSKAISDRSGMEFPYKEMVREWNGSFVHFTEYEPKQPQLRT